jgi:hypothetical protein
MGFFKQTWVLKLIVLILGVGITVIYWLGIREKQSIYLSQPTPSSQAQTITRFSPTIVQRSPTFLPSSIGQTASNANWKTYTFNKYGFSFDYPSKYSVTTANDLGVGLVDKANGQYEIFVTPEFVLSQDENAQNQTFSDFAAKQAMEQCKASGSEGQSYCDKVTQQTPLQNQHRLTGYKFYFHWLHQKFQRSAFVTVEEATVGPVLVYDISKQTNNAVRGLRISMDPIVSQTNSIDHSVLDSIGDSIRFSQ